MKHNKFILAVYEHFHLLCFATKKLPWYWNAYKWILFVIVWLHQGFVHKNWNG